MAIPRAPMKHAADHVYATGSSEGVHWCVNAPDGLAGWLDWLAHAFERPLVLFRCQIVSREISDQAIVWCNCRHLVRSISVMDPTVAIYYPGYLST